jgi:hypothetical protein
MRRALHIINRPVDILLGITAGTFAYWLYERDHNIQPRLITLLRTYKW